MPRAKLGINRKQVMASVHARCRAKIPGDLAYGSVRITLPDGRVKEYTRRYIIRDRQKYMNCVAEEIKAQLEAAARAAAGLAPK